MEYKPFAPEDKIVIERGVFRCVSDNLYEAGMLIGEIKDRIGDASFISSNAEYHFKEAATRARKLGKLLDSLSYYVAGIGDQK